MADEPSNELLLLLSQTSSTTIRPMLAPLVEIRRAIENNYRAIGRPRPSRSGLRGRRRHPEATHRHHHRDARCRRRRCPGRPGRRPHPYPGHARPRVRRPYRAVRARYPGPLPDRRRPERGADAPLLHGRRPHQPDQDHGRHEHRGASPATGRPAAYGDRRQRGRRPGRHRRHDLGRKVRHAAPRPHALRPSPESSSACPRTRQTPTPPSSGLHSAWCSAPDRPGAARPPRSTQRSPR